MKHILGMKKILLLLAAALLLTACGNQEEKLKERAAELCKYIPDHELREESREYMTEDCVRNGRTVPLTPAAM